MENFHLKYFIGNVATMSSVRNAEPEGDEKGQAYYAGGSEHSGQQGMSVIKLEW